MDTSTPQAGLSVSIILCTAAASAFVYDYLLTTGSEVSLVWKPGFRSRKLVTVLFFIARYIPFPVFVLSFYDLDLDSTLHYPYIALVIVGTAASEAMIFMRTYAIWNGFKMLLLLSFIAVVEVIVVPMTVYFFNDRIAYGLIVVNESLILSLTIVKYCRHAGSSTNGQITRLLLRDSIFYFICILATSSINLGSAIVRSDGYSLNGLSEIQLSFHCILSTRMVLNLREKKMELDSNASSIPGDKAAHNTDMC